MELINVKEVNNNIKFDLRYATKNNFTGKKLYDNPSCFLIKEVAFAINKVQLDLEKQNLNLIIWDAYRKPIVQEELRKICDNEDFVSIISNHSKGIAVDVSLCDNNKQELDMPTDFDDFSDKASSNYSNLTKEQIENKVLLKKVMEKHGFVQNEFEWWHFDYISLINSPIIDEKI